MTDTFKVLAQSTPSATTLTDVYVVPSSTTAIIYATVCNRAGSAGTFRVSLAPNGAVDANSQYLYYDQAIGANETYIIPHRGSITLDAADVLRFYGSSANFSVNVLGLEIS